MMPVAMQDLYDFLIKLGPGWMAFIMLGTVGGAISYIIANRTHIKLLHSGYSEQLKLKDELLESYRRSNEEVSKERDMYRDRLHEEKAHHQATLLRKTEIENQLTSRPDLGKILETEAKFHAEKMEMNRLMVKMNERMLETLSKMESKLDNEFSTASHNCNKALELMDALVSKLISTGALPKDYKP